MPSLGNVFVICIYIYIYRLTGLSIEAPSTMEMEPKSLSAILFAMYRSKLIRSIPSTLGDRVPCTALVWYMSIVWYMVYPISWGSFFMSGDIYIYIYKRTESRINEFNHCLNLACWALQLLASMCGHLRWRGRVINSLPREIWDTGAWGDLEKHK